MTAMLAMAALCLTLCSWPCPAGALVVLRLTDRDNHVQCHDHAMPNQLHDARVNLPHHAMTENLSKPTPTIMNEIGSNMHATERLIMPTIMNEVSNSLRAMENLKQLMLTIPNEIGSNLHAMDHRIMPMIMNAISSNSHAMENQNMHMKDEVRSSSHASSSRARCPRTPKARNCVHATANMNEPTLPTMKEANYNLHAMENAIMPTNEVGNSLPAMKHLNEVSSP